MTYNDEPYYPENEMKDYQIEIDKIIKNQLSIKHSELLAEVEELKVKVTTLSDKLLNLQFEMPNIKAKEKELENQIENVNYNIRQHKLDNLLQPFIKPCFGINANYIEKPKCQHCNDRRYLEFKSKYSEKILESQCECSIKKTVYFPIERKMFEYTLKKYAGCDEFLLLTIRNQWDESESLNFNTCVKKQFNMEDVPKLEYLYYQLLYTTQEEAQKCCDYLNSKEN